MTDQTLWCCTGRVSECPLCPQYGTSLLDPCPGHPVNDNTQTVVDTARLHAERRHPDYEYATTTGPRKQWDDADQPPYGDDGEPDTTWEPNLDAGYPGAGWERFDYTEEAYWRRPKTTAEASVAEATEATHRHPRHGLSVQQEDALWDAVAIPGTETPTFMRQHDRVCRTVAGLLLERPYQTVAGQCPACRWESLFLGSGGHVTCARDECPNPSAADQALHGELQIPRQPAPDGGPTVAEAAQADRRWPLEKVGE